IAADDATVQHGAMAHDDAFTDVLRFAVVRVDNAAVLNVDARPERDARQIAANDGPVPEIDAGRKYHIAGHHHARRAIITFDRLHRRPPPEVSRISTHGFR